MEAILRFALARPPAHASAEIAAVRAHPSAPLAGQFRTALGGTRPAARLAAVAKSARTGIGAASFLDVARGPELVAWARALLGAAPVDDTVEHATATAIAAFAGPISSIVASPDFARAKQQVVDLVACDKYGGATVEHTERNLLALRAIMLLESLSSAGLTSPAAFLRRPVVVDVEAPPRRAPRRPGARPTPAPDRRPTLTAAIAEHLGALSELQRIPPRAMGAPTAAGAPPERGATEARPLLLSPGAVTRLSPAAKGVIANAGVELGADDLQWAHGRVVEALRGTCRDYAAEEARYARSSMALRLGSAVYEVSALPAMQAAGLMDLVTLPTSHGDLASVGIADLMVVKQHLVRYEAMDISHVENVMASEHKSREHKRSLVTERSEVLETETIREEERDLQSTERSELQREAQSTMKDQLSMGFNTSVSGSYGPTVQFSVDTSLGFNSSKEESQKFAQTVAKEVTQRTASKVSERVKRTVSTKTTESVEESNIHEVDAKTRDTHVIGIYQWIDKISEAQVYNYGTRALFDFVVPEPAALLLHFASRPGATTVIPKPPPFTVSALDPINGVHEGNYDMYALRYEATGLDAPPEPTRSVGKVLEGMDEKEDRGVCHQTADLVLPDGYEAVSARVTTAFSWLDDADLKPKVEILIAGHRAVLTKNSLTATIALDGQQSGLSVAMFSVHAPQVVVTISVECVRTARALTDWQLKTWSALKQASDRQMQLYNEKVARAKAEAESQSAKEVPVRVTEQQLRDELKRLAIMMFTRQSFESFDAIDETGIKAGVDKLPGLDFDEAEAEGSYIRFFEHAFEWEQMSYVLYPYFWGRTAEWQAKVLSKQEDPMFSEFLRAGAARVVVSVRPNFELAVGHFMETGQVWTGGQSPNVTSPEYLAIVDEIRERTQAPGDEIPVDEPWEVRVATSLVRLRPQPTLPAWAKDAAGHFVPVD